MQLSFINIFPIPIIYKLDGIISFIVKCDLKMFYSVKESGKKFFNKK